MDTQEQSFWQQQPDRLPLPEELPLYPLDVPVDELDSDEDCLKDIPAEESPNEIPEPEPYIPAPEKALPESPKEVPKPEPFLPDLTRSPIPGAPLENMLKVNEAGMKIDIAPETLPFPESVFVTPAQASEAMDKDIPPTDIDSSSNKHDDEDELSSDVESIVDEEEFQKRVDWVNKMDDAKIHELVERLKKHPRFDEFYKEQVLRNQDFMKSQVEVLAFWDICKEMYSVPDGPPAEQVAKVEEKGDAVDEAPLTHKQQSALRKTKQDQNRQAQKPKPKQKAKTAKKKKGKSEKKKVGEAAASSGEPTTAAPAEDSSGGTKRKSSQLVDGQEKETLKKTLNWTANNISVYYLSFWVLCQILFGFTCFPTVVCTIDFFK